MEKIVKSFVQKIYPGIFVSEDAIEEVPERNPMLVENDGEILGFRFYDQEYIVDGDKTYYGKEKNYSSWIMFGKRYSAAEIINMYGNDPKHQILIRNIEGNGFKYICHTQVGTFLPMKNDDITFEEYEQILNSGFKMAR